MAQSFSHEAYDELVAETVENLKKLSALKGGEYAGDSDRLANFRRNGEALGLPMEAIWHTYTAKHWDAVTQYIKDLLAGKSRDRMEPLAGRLDDIIVYCVLFKAMLAERAVEPNDALKKLMKRKRAAQSPAEERDALGLDSWDANPDCSCSRCRAERAS